MKKKKKPVPEKSNYVLCAKKIHKLYRIPAKICESCKKAETCRTYQKWVKINES